MFNDTVVGLEIGKSSIKLVSGNYTMGKFSVKKCLLLDTPHNAFLPNDSIDKNVLAQHMKGFFKANKLKKKNLSLVVNTGKTVLRERVLPKAGLDELRDISKFEIEQFLPYSINDFIVDYKILDVGTDESKESLNALVAAVPKEIVESYASTAKKCGCTIKSIQIYSDCLSRFIDCFDAYAGQNVLVVDIGARVTHLTIFKDNKYFASFNSDLGGDEATRSLAMENHSEWEEAEQSKIQSGIALNKELFDNESLSGFKFNKSVFMNGFCDSIGLEISRVINFFRTRKVSGIIHKVVLLGGGSEIKEMDRYLQGILGVDVEYFKKPEKLILPQDASDETIKHIGKFVPVIGAVLRGDRH